MPSGARDFDGVDDVIYNSSVAGMPFQDFTVCMWMRPESEGEGAAGWFWHQPPGGAVDDMGARFLSTGTNNVSFTADFGCAVTINGGDNSVILNEWHHYAYRFRSSDRLIEILRDGVVIASTTGGNGTNTLPAGMIVGSLTTAGGNAFDGQIHDFRVFNVRLTDDEIKAVMRGYHVRTNQIRVAWKIRGVSDPEPDSGPSRYNATVVGTTAIDGPPDQTGDPFGFPRLPIEVRAPPAGGQAPRSMHQYRLRRVG